MYVCMSVSVCVCMYVFVCMWVCVYVFVCIVYVYVHRCMCVYACIMLYVGMHACMCVYTCTCVCVCLVCMCACMHVCVCMHACVSYCVYVCMHACVCCVYVCMHVCVCIYILYTIKALVKSADAKKTNKQSPTLSLGSKHPYPNISHEKFFTPNQPNLSPNTYHYLSWSMHTLIGRSHGLSERRPWDTIAFFVPGKSGTIWIWGIMLSKHICCQQQVPWSFPALYAMRVSQAEGHWRDTVIIFMGHWARRHLTVKPHKFRYFLCSWFL